MKSRFGRYKLGYSWAILEPLGYVGAFSIIRMAFGSSDIAGLSFPIFFCSGIIPFLLFSGTLMQSLTSVSANHSLFTYRHVKPYHCVLARLCLEFAIYFVAGVFILSVFYTFGVQFALSSISGTLGILALFFLFCLGLGLIMAVIGPLFRESEKIMPILIRPLFLISGVFFPTIEVPDRYIVYLQWNPVLHVIEFLRVNLFLNYEMPFQSIAYLSLVSFSSLFVGILAYRWKEKKLLTSGTIRLR